MVSAKYIDELIIDFICMKTIYYIDVIHNRPKLQNKKKIIDIKILITHLFVIPIMLKN